MLPSSGADYSDLIGAAAGHPFLEMGSTGPHLVLPTNIRNALAAQTNGGEVALTWHPNARFNLQAGMSMVSFHLDAKTPGLLRPDGSSDLVDAGSPRAQGEMRVHWLVQQGISIDASCARVGALPSGVAARTRLDIGLDWEPTPRMTVRFQGDDLSAGRSSEYLDAFGTQITTSGPVASVLLKWAL